MKKRLLALLLVVSLVLTIGLTGCTKPAVETNKESTTAAPTSATEPTKAEQVLTFNWSSEPPDLDPQTSTDQVSFWILNATLEGLVRLNPDGSIGEGLAKSWDISEDGLTYTFHLRDAKWSDGTAITANDFEAAWKRVLNPDTAAEYAYQLTSHIVGADEYNTGVTTDPDTVGINALDDKTLEVKLLRPTSFFLSLTSFITYVPAQAAAIEKFGDTYATDADKMVFSGPFVIESWKHEDSLVLAKNPLYWDAATVKLDKVIGYMITENNTIVQMYDNGELDQIAVPTEFLDKFIDSPEYKSLAQATTWYLEYNVEDKYFSNPKMRLAFALATDAKTYVDVIRKGMGLVATGYAPSSLAGKGHSFAEDRTSELPGYDPKEANKLFEEALAEIGATKEEFQTDVTLVAGEGDTWGKIAQFFQSQWKENLGVELFIEQMSFAMRLERYNTGTYQITYAGWGGDYNDPLTFMDMWVTDGGNNDSYWSNADYDAAIKTAIEGTGDSRIDAMVTAEAILAKELPIYPVFYPSRSIVTKPYVKGLAIYPVGADYDFKWTYIEK